MSDKVDFTKVKARTPTQLGACSLTLSLERGQAGGEYVLKPHGSFRIDILDQNGELLERRNITHQVLMNNMPREWLQTASALLNTIVEIAGQRLLEGGE